ncbi:MAG TPA: DUF5700 domain-containing putative Zn-dependent protease [Gemmatimonadales bacterium]|nr:DUF5700 domain-containing putative Zn-dependent protease [Gemmatimonadales bacterium]
MFPWRVFTIVVLAAGAAASTPARAPAPAHTPRSASTSAFASTGPSPSSRLELVTDEADAALEIVALRARGATIDESRWRRLFATEGYRRLKARETAMGRAFQDSAFRAFLLSDTLLARGPRLERTLREWKRVRLDAPASRALAYLPAGAPLRARVYLLVKPHTNSFVFEAATDPAIMLYLDPGRSAAELENTIAHELHHIGYASGCAEPVEEAGTDSAVTAARQWISAFGEGVAMLAAAGGPDVHPHATSPRADRERWDRDLAEAPRDLALVERFLLDILEGRLTDPDSTRMRGMAFFGVQGPWYTVGWLMATTIERTAGRRALVATLCDPPTILARYNEAAAASGRSDLPRWSDALLARLSSRR